MTDDDRKLLTKKLLGEKWHHITDCCVVGVWKHWWRCDCGEERFRNYEHALEHVDNRTFLTWQDVGDVKKKLVAKGMWEDFEGYAYMAYERELNINFADLTHHPSEFTSWLFRPVNEKGEAHFCQLVADFLKEEDK